MNIDFPLIAGTVSSTIFVMSTLPMLLKAFNTKDLRSYSFTNIMLSNIGNLIYAMYVYSLPVGPVWVLHGFNLVTTGLMLFWYLRYEAKGKDVRPVELATCTCP
jgi:uncharacterized protein with PQ loop repeat